MKKFVLSSSLVLGTQAVLYWLLKLFQYNYSTFYLNIDYTIPFIKYFVYVYDMFYPFMFLGLFLIYISDKTKYKNTLKCLIIGFVISDIIFLIYPTIIIRPDVKIDSLTNLVLYLTYYFDTPAINCFPSIHCLFMFQLIFSISSIKTKKIYKVSSIVFAILVILSTLFIKQHYVIDVIVAFIICLIVNLTVKLKEKENEKFI